MRLTGAKVIGSLYLRSARLSNESGPALTADGLTVETDAHLNEGFAAEGSGASGTLRLTGAHIKGSLLLHSAALSNESGPALTADGLTVETDAHLNDGFAAQGFGSAGTVRLTGAHIKGNLLLHSAALSNESGPALTADGLTVETDTYLDEGFAAQGFGSAGTVRLDRAHIRGSLHLRHATLVNFEGPALTADGLAVTSDAFLKNGFTAIGSDPAGAVRLTRATIRGDLDLASVDFPEADSANNNPTIVLTGTAVASSLRVSSHTLQKETLSGRWVVDDFTYRTLDTDPHEWLSFLRSGTLHYSPQPYQQFAAAARARGDEQLTQKILIAQHDHQLARSRNEHGLLTSRQRTALQVLRFTVGYGYRTWRAAWWLALIVVISVGTAFAVGFEKTAVFRQPSGATAANHGGPCHSVDLLTRGLEVIPLIPIATGSSTSCAVADTSLGIAFMILTIGLKIVAWALVTLFVAGYTNIVRKPGN